MHDVARETIIDKELTDVHSHGETGIQRFFDRYREFINPIVCVVLILAGWLKGESTPQGMYLALAACVLSGYPIVRNSITSTITNKKLNAEVLVTCALIASVWVGEYVAGAIVVLMMNIGELLEEITIAKTGEAVRSLMELEAETARVIRNGREIEMDIADVMIGDLVLVKPGEKIPLDGTVKEGRGEVNQAPITGESALIAKEPGDGVYGGTLNQIGVLKIEVTRVSTETVISKIIDMVHKAQAEKPPIERVADRFASWFTPVMLALACLVWIVTGEVLRAVTVLVVACPCALVIATPTAVVAGIGNAARRGILIKGGAVLEVIVKLTTFVFDKTGTLTYGAPTVKHVHGFDDVTKNKVLSLAGTAERHSEHPLAEAILKCCREEEAWPLDPESTEVIVGKGIVAKKDGREIIVGNERLFNERGIELTSDARQFLDDMVESGATGVIVGEGTRIVGGVGIADVLKEDVYESIKDIKRLGIKKVLMLTGDNKKVAQAISEGAGLDKIVADLLPEAKLEYVKKLKAQGEKVAMVGDGINDAPSLVEADVGIAMGVIGTDAAIEAADIVLTSDNLGKASEAIALSRKTVSIIKQSLFISVAINSAALILASTGEIGPIVGAIIHNIGSIVVVGNSSRLIGYRFKKNN
ncbi:MAG: cadmium-translocating P-type ATPase [Deltaproteobacteria bacterium]|nr:cadmium-translocating P-type ATPase [Deltaproteobacteria bacterium]